MIPLNSLGTKEQACPIHFTSPIRHEWFYEVMVVSMGVGGHILDIPCVQYNNEKTIVDSGTSNLRLPSPVSFK